MNTIVYGFCKGFLKEVIAGMAKNETTSKRVAKTASKLLRSKTSSKSVKSVSGSALTQRVRGRGR